MANHNTETPAAQPDSKELIIKTLQNVATTKQMIYQESRRIFSLFKNHIRACSTELVNATKDSEYPLEINYKENGEYEIQLTIAGDILLFSLHTNVFNFNDEHFIHKTPYVQEDYLRAYCSMIQIHNFLADSFRFNRLNDLGYLIARIFINKEQHFFVEGKRQLGFLYSDFATLTLEEKTIVKIIDSSILYALDFDLLVPPYEKVKISSVLEILKRNGTMALKTGKRVGFQFKSDTDILS